MADRHTLFDSVLRSLQQEASLPQDIWQLAIIAVALLAGWWYAKRVRRRTEQRMHDVAASSQGRRVDVLRFSIAGYRRLALPVVAILVMVIGGLALYLTRVAALDDMHLLRLAVLLLGAMAAIRLFVYILRRSLPRAAWIGSFELGIALTIWVMVALHVTGLLGDLIGYLDSIHFPIGKPPLTLWDLLAVGQCGADCARALWVGSVIESRVMGATSLTANSRVVLSRSSRQC